MTSTTQLLRVFLCHASGDKPAVIELYNRLTKDGVDVWLDKEKLIPGQNWQVEISKAVRNSDVVLVCLSSNSINKEGFVQKEIRFALDVADEKPDGTIFIIPTRLENCHVPERISKFHWVDLFEKDGYVQLLKALQIKASSIDRKIEPLNITPFSNKRKENVFTLAQSIKEQISQTAINSKPNNAGEKEKKKIENDNSRVFEEIKNSEYQKINSQRQLSNRKLIEIPIIPFLFSSLLIFLLVEFFLQDISNVILITLFVAFFLPGLIYIVVYNRWKSKDKMTLEHTNKKIEELKEE